MGGCDTDIEEAIQIHNLDEVVFSGRDVRTDTIVEALPMREGVGNAGLHGPMSGCHVERRATRESLWLQRGLHLPKWLGPKVVRRCVFCGCDSRNPGFLVARRSSWIAMAWRVLIGRCTWSARQPQVRQAPFVRCIPRHASRGQTERPSPTPKITIGERTRGGGGCLNFATSNHLSWPSLTSSSPKWAKALRSHDHQIGGGLGCQRRSRRPHC